MNPKYPVYIISKGRADSRLTQKELERLNVPYHIVIEQQEFDAYNEHIDEEKIKVLPFSNLGQGSIPARNWVWEDSIERGYERHWILDDNIASFLRLNRNAKIRVASGTIFKCAEDFTERYENVGISGFNYGFFANAASAVPPYYLNTRVYSMLLIRNDLQHRWRGRYNEDTDLCLRVLKDGFCTILFNAFLGYKTGTMQMKGGNTDELYADDGRLQMAQSLVDQHPDVCTVSWKFGRYQHHVDYSSFRNNQLIRKQGVEIPEGINNYGMKLTEISEKEFDALQQQ